MCNFNSVIPLPRIYLKETITDKHKDIHHCTVYTREILETSYVAKNKELLLKTITKCYNIKLHV
jgi:hypothetical protein